MSNARGNELWEVVRRALDQGMNLVYASSALELQTDAINILADAAEQVLKFGDTAREMKNEEEAKAAFVMLQWIAGTADALWMWVHIKQDQMEQAWDSLVSSQEHLNCGLRFAANDAIRDLARILDTLERTIFPPQVFTSSGLTFEYATCNICEGIYGECGHVEGRLYLGQLCGKRLVNIGVDHTAIVDLPADKGCRMTAVQDGSHMRCKLTSRMLEKVDPADGPEGHWKATSILIRPSITLGVRRAVVAKSSDETEAFPEEEGSNEQ